MTKVKLCGLSRPCDIEYANEISPEYVGFVFFEKSRRYVSPKQAEILRKKLKSGIIPVGVFVDEKAEVVADLVNRKIIQAVQLHGNEDKDYIKLLKSKAACTVIKAFVIRSEKDVLEAEKSCADLVLLDSGAGTGTLFDHSLIRKINRPYFLAGGLTPENAGEAVKKLSPYAVDASSSLEKDGFKDKDKMTAFVNAVRNAKMRKD